MWYFQRLNNFPDATLCLVMTLLQSWPPEIGLQLWENNLILALTMTAGNEAHCYAQAHRTNTFRSWRNTFMMVYTLCLLLPPCSLGLTPWNLSCFEFKFDDTRHSYKYKIGPIKKNVASWLCSLSALLAVSAYIMRKVWYHQIWIQNYLGFIVSDLT